MFTIVFAAFTIFPILRVLLHVTISADFLNTSALCPWGFGLRTAGL